MCGEKDEVAKRSITQHPRLKVDLERVDLGPRESGGVRKRARATGK